MKLTDKLVHVVEGADTHTHTRVNRKLIASLKSQGRDPLETILEWAASSAGISPTPELIENLF